MDDETSVTPIDSFRQKFLELHFVSFFYVDRKTKTKKNVLRFAKVITKFSSTWFLRKPTLFTCIYWVQAHIMSTCTGAIACHNSTTWQIRWWHWLAHDLHSNILDPTVQRPVQSDYHYSVQSTTVCSPLLCIVMQWAIQWISTSQYCVDMQNSGNFLSQNCNE